MASRRLREALPVLATTLKKPKASKARRQARHLTRALGGVREMDVTLTLLDELAASDDFSRTALQDVRMQVIAERDTRREAMLARLSDIDSDKLNRRLHGIADALALKPDDTWRQTLATRLLNRGKRLAAAIDEAGPLYAPEHLHRVRIAVKKLRYGLEVAADAGIGGAAALVRTLKRTQETLGRLHDLQVLQTYVAAAQGTPTGRSVPHAGLAAIAGKIEEQCRLLHGRYVAAVPALLDVTATVRTDIVSRLTRRRARPLKMSLRRTRKAAEQGR